jgi:hypothetical protein
MFTLTDALRLAGSLGMVLFAMAVGVAKLVPADPQGREPAPAPTFISGFGCRLDEPGPFRLDAGRMALERFPLPDGDHASHLRAAPWRDRRGATRVVGRWWGALDADGRLPASQGPGLALYAFPEGTALERITTDVAPTAPPCWVPGREASIVYAASDGRLYRLDFDAGRADRRPRLIRWAVPEPGDGPGQAFDPEWPADPRFARTFLVALATNNRPESTQRLDPTALWWLRLDLAGTAIEAAGPVAWPAGADATRDRRFPVVVARPDGGLTLASLTGAGGDSGWRLEAVDVRVDPESGAVVPLGPSRTLAEDLCGNVPTPAPDGRSLLVMRRDATARAVPARIPLQGGPNASLATIEAAPRPAADRS